MVTLPALSLVDPHVHSLKIPRRPSTGADGGFWDRGGREIQYSGSMGAKAPIRSANGATFLGGPGQVPPGKFLKLKFSEMQSSAFWTLKFTKCLDSTLNQK